MENQPLKYVSPEYQRQLDELAETLMLGVRNRLAASALGDTVEIEAVHEDNAA